AVDNGICRELHWRIRVGTTLGQDQVRIFLARADLGRGSAHQRLIASPFEVYPRIKGTAGPSGRCYFQVTPAIAVESLVVIDNPARRAFFSDVVYLVCMRRECVFLSVASTFVVRGEGANII